jgi:two-component system, NarL family, nitrate/nitrite response regulator NarL
MASVVGERLQMSEREHEILMLTAAGRSAPAIARQLGLSVATVKTVLLGCYEKLGATDRAGLVDAAARSGLLD